MEGRCSVGRGGESGATRVGREQLGEERHEEERDLGVDHRLVGGGVTGFELERALFSRRTSKTAGAVACEGDQTQ